MSAIEKFRLLQLAGSGPLDLNVEQVHNISKFVTKNALKNHIKQVHLSETSTCHICHKEYKDLYHHVKYFHERIRSCECGSCEKKFQADLQQDDRKRR